MQFNNNVTLLLTAIANTFREDVTISIYEWHINSKTHQTTTNTYIVQTSSLPVGTNTFSLRVKNSLNIWSELTTVPVDIISVPVIVKPDIPIDTATNIFRIYIQSTLPKSIKHEKVYIETKQKPEYAKYNEKITVYINTDNTVKREIIKVTK